ncbi:MAG: RNA-binding S4 domain-containing protein [Bacilli bacterium]|nr:RNA-binding S4 domain-containing protein [Bacilli bacterium]MBO7536017.1 RNA-binding S4 domain-containing protein [Bacilli bacterium]
MRLDKYLKVSRIIKRRTVAADAAKDEHIYVNGRLAKPSTNLKTGDIIDINYSKKIVKVKVLSIDNVVKASDASSMYEIIEVIEK